MAVSNDELELLIGLHRQQQAEQPTVELNNRYYDGSFRLEALGMSLPPEIEGLYTVVNWPRLVVSAIEERLDIEGIRIGDDPDPDEEMWSWWLHNDLAEQSTLLHTEAFVTGRAFITVGFDEDTPEIPRICAESARTMSADVDPRTGAVRAAARFYSPDHEFGGQPSRATLYLPEATRFVIRDQGRWVPDPDLPDVEHGLGVVPVVPVVNRARLGQHNGRPLFEDIKGLTDAACRTMTNLQAAQELMAVPQRVVFGVSSQDFVDEHGEQIPKWQAYLGRLLTFPDTEGKISEFTAASLNNYHGTIQAYARQVSALTGLPIRYLGVVSESNPAGADAIVADESRLIKLAERTARALTIPWRRAISLGRRMVYGDTRRPETIDVQWRDPATHTQSALADSVVKLYTASNQNEGPLIPRLEAWKRLGYGPEDRRRLESYYQDDPLSAALALEGGPVGEAVAVAPGQSEPATGVAGRGDQ